MFKENYLIFLKLYNRCFSIVTINDINTITVVGAGIMGHEIAQVALMGGFKTVILNDLTKNTIKKAAIKIKKGLEKLELKDKLNEGYTASNLMDNLVKEVSLEKALKRADFVIEAIPEVMILKKELFEKLGKFAPENAILTTNTSMMSVSEIASKSGRPDKVIGCHFFTPIVVLRLIEIIKGKKTSEDTVKIVKEICKKFPALQGKRFLPVLQNDSPGFIVNRLNAVSFLYLNWLLEYSMEKGIALESLDADAEILLKVGPFAKLDYLGLDTIFNAMNYFAGAVSPDFTPGETITRLVNTGNLGRKTGKGLYNWEGEKLIIPKKEKAGLLDIELLMATQLNEGCRLLEEGVVSGFKIIDEAMMAGMNIPGPFGPGKRYYHKWTILLEDFIKKSGISYLKPCKLMKSGDFVKMRK
ncbi:MAG: 3-hydroxyacyl-CoA dehydrogenase NAD-binding domain-containing protein [Candidatus Thorarchaeota archaeon]